MLHSGNAEEKIEYKLISAIKSQLRRRKPLS
jgi:hypothetical protein